MNIYVGNLPYGASEEDVKNLFSEHGKVTETKIIINKHTGQSKGFGFVTFENEESGQIAIDKLNEADFQGRKLRVSKASK